MKSLNEQKIDITLDILTIRSFKVLASAETTGWVELARLFIKSFIYITATFQEISLNAQLKEIESLIYEEERKQNNTHEVNSNENIG